MTVPDWGWAGAGLLLLFLPFLIAQFLFESGIAAFVAHWKRWRGRPAELRSISRSQPTDLPWLRRISFHIGFLHGLSVSRLFRSSLVTEQKATSLQQLSDPPRGRDVFVDGPQTPAEIGALFGQALGVAARGVVLEDAPKQTWSGSWEEARRIAIYRLERDGDFAFKISVDLDTPIDVTCFPRLAQKHGMKIAWCVDKSAAHDYSYHVAFPDGSIAVRPRAFRETPGLLRVFHLGSRSVERRELLSILGKE